MPNSPVIGDPGVPHSWGEVRAHDQVMRYQRLGSGRPLLLLDACSAFATETKLHRALLESHRLIIPELPPFDVHLATWLADFLEGMGTSRLAVLATEPYWVPALELALLGNDQVARIVFLTGGREPSAELYERGALEMAANRARVPVLLARCSPDPEAVVHLVRNFLSEG